MKIRLSQRQSLSTWQKVGIATFVLTVLGFVLIKTFIPIPSEASTVQSLEKNQWLGSKGHRWKDAANWSLGRVPNAGDLVVLHSGAAEENEIEIAKKETVQVGAIDLSGCKLVVEGTLNVTSYLQALSKGSFIEVTGQLTCQEDLILLSHSQLSVKGGSLSVAENLLMEEAIWIQEEGETTVAGDVELRRKGSLFHVIGGAVNITGDMVAHHSIHSVNRLRVSGGDMWVKGTTVFQKTNENEHIPASVLVDGGLLQLNETNRGRGQEGYLPGVYNYRIEGGELLFHKDVNLDTLQAGESSSRTLGQDAASWSEDAKYLRQESDDLIKVRYQGWVYALSQSYWAANGEKPGVSDKWVLIGKADEVDESFDLALVDEWKSSKLYQRSDVSEEVFVKYLGTIYRLSHTCNMSKNNVPDENEWAWLLWHQPGEAEVNYSDAFFVSGGKVRFKAAFQHWRGFETYGSNVLVFEGDGVNYPLKDGDVYHSIEIGPYARISSTGTSFIKGNISNQSSDPVSGNGTLTLAGSDDQHLRSFKELVVGRIEMRKDTGVVFLRGNLKVNYLLQWTNITPLVADRSIDATKSVLHFGVKAQVLGSGWYEGPIEKRGLSAFDFPTGKNGKKASISISASKDTCTYRAEYFEYDVPSYLKTSTELSGVSQMEYWSLKSIENGGKADVTLHWSNGSWSQIQEVSDLVVAEYHGTEWHSLGQNASVGSARSGAISAEASISKASYYTYGSISTTNSFTYAGVPVTVQRNQDRLTFYASDLPDGLKLDAFQLSEEGSFQNFETQWVQEQDGLYYVEVTSSDEGSELYARLVLKNQAGEERVSAITKVQNGSTPTVEIVSLYPNPVQDNLSSNLSLQSSEEASGTAHVVDAKGAVVQEIEIFLQAGQSSVSLPKLSQLQQGNYQLVVEFPNYRDAVSFMKL